MLSAITTPSCVSSESQRRYQRIAVPPPRGKFQCAEATEFPEKSQLSDLHKIGQYHEWTDAFSIWGRFLNPIRFIAKNG
jgi:hypothetical protein